MTQLMDFMGHKLTVVPVNLHQTEFTIKELYPNCEKKYDSEKRAIKAAHNALKKMRMKTYRKYSFKRN